MNFLFTIRWKLSTTYVDRYVMGLQKHPNLKGLLKLGYGREQPGSSRGWTKRIKLHVSLNSYNFWLEFLSIEGPPRKSKKSLASCPNSQPHRSASDTRYFCELHLTASHTKSSSESTSFWTLYPWKLWPRVLGKAERGSPYNTTAIPI